MSSIYFSVVRLWVAIVLGLLGNFSLAGEVRVAVAANFVFVLEQIARDFKERTGHEVIVSNGSTGQLYALIVNGAPFDVFLSADTERPRRLEERGLALPASRFAYARGRLVLWAPDYSADSCRERLSQPNLARYLAIANPDTAPYGRAARETLISLELWRSWQSKLVKGESISQTLQFVLTGNAEIGFVAASQILALGERARGCTWVVPSSLHQPIEQQGLLLVRSAGNEAALEFLTYLKSQQVGALICSQGYELP